MCPELPQLIHCRNDDISSIVMIENGQPSFLLMLLANANVPTVAVCLDPLSSVTQLYRPPYDFMNSDTTLISFPKFLGLPQLI